MNTLWRKAIISRTSNYGGDEKPCDEAKRETLVWVDKRVVDNPEKLHASATSWHNEGRNHRVENGCICRDFDCEEWIVELQSPIDLIKLVMKYGRIIIDIDENKKPPVLNLEIYDDYRE